MNSPFWNFFNRYREQASTPLAIDQYFYFLKAWYALPMPDTIKDIAELRRFCKLFWLRDSVDEVNFDRIFDMHLDMESWQTLWSTPATDSETKKPLTGEAEDTDSEGTEQSSTGDTSEPDTSPDHQPAGEQKKKEENQHSFEDQTFVDFELIISDHSGMVAEKQTELIEHNYHLNDQAIMPFNLRYFAQRLRRKIQTPLYEYTDRLNLPKIVSQFSQQGYIDNLIYERRNASNSNIVFLADREGSMLAYEFWEQQLTLSFKAIPACKFEHYIFYNLPHQEKNGSNYLLHHSKQKRRPLNTARHHWTKDTCFFIFSDAGAHSGLVNKDRLWESLELWYFLKSISQEVYWLNPVPAEYQNDCTAKRLTFTIPMIYPDEAGLDFITNRQSNE